MLIARGPIIHRRDDLQDLLHDQQYFQAIFHSLEHVKAVYRAQDEIVMANEAIASEPFHKFHHIHAEPVQRITLLSRTGCTK